MAKRRKEKGERREPKQRYRCIQACIAFNKHEPANGVALFSSGLAESLAVAEQQAHNGPTKATVIKIRKKIYATRIIE